MYLLAGKSVENQSRYKFVLTADGSVTLSVPMQDEIMHNTSGALSETIHVYEGVVEHVVKNSLPPQFLVVGLGLGYIEMMVCAYLIRHSARQNHQAQDQEQRQVLVLEQGHDQEQRQVLVQEQGHDQEYKQAKNNLLEQLKIVSYECDSYLKNYFIHFLEEKFSQIPSDFLLNYQDILSRVASHYDIAQEALFKNLQMLFFSGALVIKDHFSAQEQLPFSVSGICFDPYSNNTNFDVWCEGVFACIFRQTFAKCVFATYASRTSLKKLFKQNNFSMLKKSGFGHKRECTFAFIS